jgi:hypothetical protein
MKAQTP